MSLVVLQVIGQQRLVAQTSIVEERETGNPVAVFQFTMTLDIVLATGEVPKEITPVHPVTLIGEEEFQILHLCRYRYKRTLTIVRWLLLSLDASNPAVVCSDMALAIGVHTWEYHILCIDGLILCANHKVCIGLVGRLLLLTLIDRCTRIHLNMTALVNLVFRTVGLTECQRAIAILVAAQVITKGENILG